MNMRLAAAISAAVILVGMLHAPVVPVMIGTSLAYARLLWRSFAAR